MGTKIEVSFTGEGAVTQTIELADDIPYTPEEVVEMLETGEILTTIQVDGAVVLQKDRTPVGRVVRVKNEMKYDFFSLEEVDGKPV